MTNDLMIIQPGQLDRATENPVLLYLADLTSDRSKATMLQGLNTVAKIITDGLFDAIELNQDWAKVKRPTMLKLKTELIARYKPNTANRLLTGVRMVLKECWKLGLISAEDLAQASEIKPVKGTTLPAGRDIARDEIAALLESCYNDPHPAGVRDAAIIAVLWSGGIRRAELTALQLEDYIKPKGSLQILHGKGDKARVVPLADSALMLLDAWIERRGDQAGDLWYKFTRPGIMLAEPISSQGIYDMIKRRVGRADIKDCGLHDFRRSAVSDYLSIGVDISTVAKIMGHSSVTTTARYDLRGDEAKQAAAKLRSLPGRE